MASIQLTELLKACHGTAVGAAGEVRFEGVCTDTRALQSGSLFVALRGDRFDGHDYLEQARAAGAVGALVDTVQPPCDGLIQVRVDDTRRALGRLGSWYAGQCRARRIAVTGSNGKTTTKQLLGAALARGGETMASPKSFNNEIGVPLTLLGIGEETDYAVIEVGTNHPGEIARLAELVQPQVGLVTNCTWAHIEHLGDLDGVVREKGALIEALPADGLAVLNADDPSHAAIRERASCRVITFGIRCEADYRAVDVQLDWRRVEFVVRGERVAVPLGGTHNVSNALAAMAIAEELGIPRAQAAQGLLDVEAPPMRLSVRAGRHWTVLDDTYNSNPGSVEAAFRTLAATPSRAKVVVLGDMLELGDRAAELHAEAGRWTGLVDLRCLVAVGRYALDVQRGALERGFPEDRIRVFANATAAARAMERWAEPGDTVLVKGSRGMHMERVVETLCSEAAVQSAG